MEFPAEEWYARVQHSHGTHRALSRTRSREEEHPFCPCCLFTNSHEAFKPIIESPGLFAIRLYAARDASGEPTADCRINGKEFEPGKAELRTYVAKWPDAGVEFRKQYVVVHGRKYLADMLKSERSGVFILVTRPPTRFDFSAHATTRTDNFRIANRPAIRPSPPHAADGSGTECAEAAWRPRRREVDVVDGERITGVVDLDGADGRIADDTNEPCIVGREDSTDLHPLLLSGERGLENLAGAIGKVDRDGVVARLNRVIQLQTDGRLSRAEQEELRSYFSAHRDTNSHRDPARFPGLRLTTLALAWRNPRERLRSAH